MTSSLTVPEPINLTQLRHDIKLARAAGYPIEVTPAQLLALIDTAEAALVRRLGTRP
jgi:hypothetical protein